MCLLLEQVDSTDSLFPEIPLEDEQPSSREHQFWRRTSIVSRSRIL